MDIFETVYRLGFLSAKHYAYFFWHSAKAKWTTQIRFPYIFDDVMHSKHNSPRLSFYISDLRAM